MIGTRYDRLLRLLQLCGDAANAATQPAEELRLHERWSRVLDATVAEALVD